MPRLQSSAGFLRALDDNADALNGAAVRVYENLTTTPVTTYIDAALTIAQPFPVLADAAGRFPSIYVAPGNYRIRLETAGGVLIAESDNNVVFGADPNAVAAAAFKTVALFLADTTTGYALSGSVSVVVSAGDIVEAGGFRYSVAASSATNFDVETAGGLKAIFTPGEMGANVMAFGASGEGVIDDAPFIQKAITHIKRNPNYNYGANGVSRGGSQLYFPAGIYRINTTVEVQNVNGIKFVGAGAESTVLMWTGGAGNMLNVGQHINNSWSDMMWVSATGPATTSALGNANIPERVAGNLAGTAFNWDGVGGDRFNKFYNIHVRGGFDKCFHVQGTVTHDSTGIYSSHFFRCNYVWYSENAQSVNNQFYGCDFENIELSVFYFVAGGFFTVHGGSCINPRDTLTLAGTDAQIGTANGSFLIQNVKWEMYQNAPGGPWNPYLVRVTGGSTAANVRMNNCSNNGGLPDASATMIIVAGSTNLTLDGCNMIGKILCQPTGGFTPFVKQVNCRNAVEVLRTSSGGTTYRSIIENCNAVNSTGMIDTTQFAFQNKSMTLPSSLVHYKGVNNIATASNFDFEVLIPDVSVISDAMFSLQRTGANNITLQIFANSARTVAIFSQDTGTSVTRNLWRPTITAYNGIAAASYIAGDRVYGRIVAGGNVGLVTLNLWLNCFQLTNG